MDFGLWGFESPLSHQQLSVAQPPSGAVVLFRIATPVLREVDESGIELGTTNWPRFDAGDPRGVGGGGCDVSIDGSI